MRGMKADKYGQSRGEGPVRVHEALHLRSMSSENDTAVESLLSLKSASEKCTEDETAITNEALAHKTSDKFSHPDKDPCGRASLYEDENVKRPVESYLSAATTTTTSFDAASSRQLDDDPDVVAPAHPHFLGLALEYAAGIALRDHVLEPVIRDFPSVSEAEATRLLAMYSRGEFIFLNGPGGVQQGSIARVESRDAQTMGAWWDEDRHVSYSDQAWSDWWIQRCNIFDPGCEMVKLLNAAGETLGVVYFERNIVDRNKFGVNGTITLIRGIRMAPSLNPEVLESRDLAQKQTPGAAVSLNSEVSSLLFQHVLFMSLRYGTNAVSVNCPKINTSERLYHSLMGEPLTFDESGRPYYRINQQQRWNILRKGFHLQVELWQQQQNSD